MPTISVTVPNSGAVVTKLGQVAQAKDAAEVPGGPNLTNAQAVTWMVREYLKSVYRQAAVNDAAAAAQTAVNDAQAQADTDTAAIT